MDKMMIRGAVLVTALMSAATLGFVSPAPQAEDVSAGTTVDTTAAIEGHNDAVTELGKKCTCPKGCAMQKWMKKKMQRAMGSGKMDKVAKALSVIASKPPAGYSDWKKISEAGVAAAKAGDKKGVKKSCNNCHKLYQKKYRKSEMRCGGW